jgi:ATP synthase F1 gamma subunit
MPQKKEIIEEIAALDNIKDMAENYEEIAATRMQRIKDSVLQSRDYLAELSDVFVDLKSSYQKEVKDILEKRKKGDRNVTPLLQKNGRTLLVYLSSNGRLYGPVTKKTFDLFVTDLKQKDNDKLDILIMGGAGKEMFETSGINKKFEYIHVPDDAISDEEVKAIMKKYLEYEHVYIYYGKFGNVVKQIANSTSITGEDIFETEVPSTVPREDRFIFEPALDKIFHFFETQIMSTLFRQTFLENQLARQASRVNAMEEALVHIEEEAKKLNHEKVRIRHLTQNRKQLETMSGFVLWDIG